MEKHLIKTALGSGLLTLVICSHVPAALASHISASAPGSLHAQSAPVVAPSMCWGGTVVFTPSSPDNGNPPSFHKLIVSGASGAFSQCIGQYADLSIDHGGQQIDYARSYLLAANDGSHFTVKLSKGTLPNPVPAGTTFTLVIHP